MGKIVKFCAACDESFAEKFAFCPNCGQVMNAFEMNPLAAAETKISDAPIIDIENEKKIEPEISSDVPISAPVLAEVALNAEKPESATTREFFTVNPIQPSVVKSAEKDEPIYEPAIENDFEPETKTFATTAGASGNGNNHQINGNDYQSNFTSPAKPADDGYRITVIEEKNVGQRNGLLLATMVLMITVVLGATVYSLFNKELLVGAIDQDDPLYVSMIDEPMEVEEQPKVKNDDDGGGGGGGGKEEKEKASTGRLPTQTEKPLNPPSVNVPQMTNPTLRYDMSTQGNIKREKTTERIGLPGSDNLNPSNGTGRGGGIGGGTGTGIGGGNGTGEGNGNGSGSGNGNGNGNGNGTGDGSGIRNPPPPPPVVKAGPTEAIKIISKPQPRYTDAARQNNISGTVTLKVTFTANGQIGSIAPVSGLPYGLTEQAIAAARQIRFEPPKKNGVPYGVSKTVSYTFTIY